MQKDHKFKDNLRKLSRFYLKIKMEQVWNYSSVAETLSSIHKALSSNPSTLENKLIIVIIGTINYS